MYSLKRGTNLALTILVLLTISGRIFLGDTDVSPDSPRYVAMGMNLSEFGILTGTSYTPGVEPEAGLGHGGVFTAMEIALAARLSDTTARNFACIANDRTLQACQTDLPSLKAVYVLEMFLFHMAVFFVARTVFGHDIKAWIAVAVSLSFKETREYASSILSEPAYFMTVGLFLIFWLKALRQPDALKLVFGCGVALGLLTLVKPAWNAQLPGLALLTLLVLLVRREITLNAIRAIVVFTGGVLIMTTPLLMRNVMQLDMWGLSEPAYMIASLAHRFAFNAMSWSEWGAGWLYFLPDFGDKAATHLFGKSVVAKLDTGPDSYYVYGRDVLHQLVMNGSSAEQAKGILLEQHFFNAPLKGFAVTALLGWRGIFVGNLLGLAAVVLAAPVLWLSDTRVRRDILMLCVPLLVMVGVHALVSINIHRYNIGLIVPYALILAQALFALGKGLSTGRSRLIMLRKQEMT